MKEQKLTRRSFLGLGATAAVAGAAGLAGCAPAAKSDAGADAGAADGGSAAGSGAAGGKPTEFVPSFMNAPEPIDESKVTETVDTDVCVVGLGLAGVCALREAAESGAKVFGFDKGPDVGYRSGEFGTFGSEIHKQLGIEQPETQEVVNELMRVMGNRPNAQLLNYWIGNSGQDLDWYIGSAEHELLTSDHDTPTDPEKPYVFPERCPVNENYNWREENYPCFPGMVHLLPDHGWAMHGTLEAAQKAGAEARFNLKGEQLIKEGDKVVGVYASDEDGNIVRVNAKKGVVLSTGDISSDTEMLTYYAPQATKYGVFFSSMDKSGKPVNTGDGHKMAMWAGAVMEDGPYAPMTHSLGTNSIGIDPYLMVNQDGKRFANEDVGAQELQNAIKRQKGGVSYQIFDSKWKEQLSAMPQCFGGVTHYIPPEQEAEYEHAINHFAAGYASDTYFAGEIEAGSIIQADTIEELAKAVSIPADALTETVERYNELAHAGKDTDFSKVSTRLFPIENPPYYVAPFGDSGMLVLIGGIDCDAECHALDAEKNQVPGLFVAGNTMGGRFLVDYPVTVAGASHSMAMSFGRLAGRNAAAGK